MQVSRLYDEMKMSGVRWLRCIAFHRTAMVSVYLVSIPLAMLNTIGDIGHPDSIM
jgi:hypothetical protein